MRSVLNDDARRLIPCTSYPFARRNSARYAPSWPVMPVIKAFLPLLSVFNRCSQEQAAQDVLLNEPTAADVLEVVTRNAKPFLAAIENVIGQDAAVSLPQQAFRHAAVVTQIFVEAK